MNEAYAPYLMIVFFMLFGIMWFFVTNALRNMAGMSKDVDINVEAPIDTSEWGSGIVNGVSMKNALRVVCYSEGFLLETRKFLGGGKLWLPKSEIVINDITDKTMFKPKQLDVFSGKDRVSLYGALIDAIIR